MEFFLKFCADTASLSYYLKSKAQNYPSFSSVHPETKKQLRLFSFLAVATHQMTIMMSSIEVKMKSKKIL